MYSPRSVEIYVPRPLTITEGDKIKIVPVPHGRFHRVVTPFIGILGNIVLPDEEVPDSLFEAAFPLPFRGRARARKIKVRRMFIQKMNGAWFVLPQAVDHHFFITKA